MDNMSAVVPPPRLEGPAILAAEAPGASPFLSPSYHPQLDPFVGIPHSRAVDATFTDLYQITMMYAYWRSDRHNTSACFDLFFRKCPFGGEFAIFAGLEETLRFVNTLRFTQEQLEYIRLQLSPDAPPSFFDYLMSIDGGCLQIFAVPEGTLIFPREPVIRVEGPLAVCQLVETAIINLTNFSSLVATNAARFRLATGWDKSLLEFGARRAQGPDGALSASRYSYVGGFDGTSNVKAGHMFGIPVKGTHAHSFVTSFRGLDCLTTRCLPGSSVDFVELVRKKKKEFVSICLSPNDEYLMNEGELAAFVAYALSFPESFLCLVDTYDTLGSGIPNFLVVALVLLEFGHRAVGVRLDSGDLAYLSRETRKIFVRTSENMNVDFGRLQIVASNDINESVLHSLKQQGNEIDAFGIGTHLVTCQAQPALGMVYKLCEVDGRPCMKLSQDIEKNSIPARKALYRLYNKLGQPTVDFIQEWDKPPPAAGTAVFCRHLFDDSKRCFVVSSKVENLLQLVWADRTRKIPKYSLKATRNFCMEQLRMFREDHLRLVNPTPYKVSASLDFYNFFHSLWQQTAPVQTIV
eukprot:GHVS01047056.1.p1 GENE.GHVS01047056.1~~GHVS01047056.1.p1  ORF type:complete len:578 (+),score=59.44 GHVS01047056.1:51-1784(+)